MKYSSSEIALIISAIEKKKRKDVLPISKVVFDSRSIDISKESLFFALETSSNNGHFFIQEAYKKGARAFVVSKDENWEESFEEGIFFLVENTLLALQHLAKHYRNLFNLKVIAITGSKGKTTLKEWMSSFLEEDFFILKSPKGYNSQLGVPISLLEINKQHQIGIFEANTSHPSQMKALSDLISPHIGILINVGETYLENFSSPDEHILEKLKLFIGVHSIITSMDDKKLYEQVEKNLPQSKKYYWGRSKKAHLRLNKITFLDKDSLLDLTYEGKDYKLKLPFRDNSYIETILALFLSLLVIGYDPKKIIERLSLLTYHLKIRLELLKGVNNTLLIYDTYDLDLYSIKIALEVLSRQVIKKKSIIISDVLKKIPEDNQKKYTQLAELINSISLYRIIAIGKDIGNYKKLFKHPFYHFNSTEAFLVQMKRSDFYDEVLLLKGARSFKFENILHRLEQYSHDTIYEINLSSLIYNLNWFRSKLSPHTKIMAMVKAFSYGMGTYQIASILEHHKIDYLAVAYVDEGITLREENISLPILVMNPDQNTYPLVIEYHLEPEIYSFHGLKLFFDELKKHACLKYPIHIKIDTGMHRLGFSVKEAEKLGKLLKENNSLIQVKSIFSHLSASEDINEKDFTLNQIASFEKAYEILSLYLTYNPLRHILNSSGIINYPKAHFDMVRLGGGLYGTSQIPYVQSQLKVVGVLKTIISQIKHLYPGDTVSYNRRFKAAKKLKMAVLPVGYADGFKRNLGHQNTYVLINGHKAPILGSICMDMTMVDITHIACKEGDMAILFGEDPTIEDLAKKASTIPYDILTGISHRVKRIYYEK